MNETKQKQVPNLKEIDEQEASRFLTGFLSRLDPEEEYNMRHEVYVMEMPQSGELIRARENMWAFQEVYPATTPPTIRLRRVLVRGVYEWSRGSLTTARGSRH
jgi:hypothetical protein